MKTLLKNAVLAVGAVLAFNILLNFVSPLRDFVNNLPGNKNQWGNN